MKRINLSEWALRHRSFVLFLMIVTALAGLMSYSKLGQSEDPPFTFKVMVVRTQWPGATAREVELQLTEQIEKKLQETPHLDVLRSSSKPGESMIFIILREDTRADQVPDAWYQVRKKIGDIRDTLPTGIQGPYFNDEFGDTLGNLYALTGDGYSYGQMKDIAEKVRLRLLGVPDVGKVELVGLQDQKVFVELSNTKLATLGLDPQAIMDVLQKQNAMVPDGSFDTGGDHIYLRTSGAYDSVQDIADTPLRANGRLLRLGDIARVYRGYEDPPRSRMRFMSRDVVGVGVSMVKGGDIIALGKNLDATVSQLQKELPVGMELAAITRQPEVVSHAVGEFVRSLSEAVVIVLAVSFLSLGLRSGLVVALSIPLVLAATFTLMHFFNIGLHKISLGALILSLGLLVDDAIIAVEMMAIKIEQGWDRVRAASFAYTSTAFPMLTGTLVTAAGFLPIATAASTTGEYTRSIFQVTVIALLLSWVAAVVFIPYLGYRLLPANERGGHLDDDAVYQKPFYRRFRSMVAWCVRHRRKTIGVTVLAFVLSLAGFGLVQQQFFPDSTRLELIVDLRLAEGSAYAATEAEVKKLERILAADKDVANYVSYVGSGSPRFYLSLDQQLPATNFAQFVVTAKGQAEREAIRTRLLHVFEQDFSAIRTKISRLENGPPVGFPVVFRVMGEDVDQIRAIATEVATVMRQNPHLSNVQFDWSEPSKVIRIDVDQNKARLLGITSQDLSLFLQTALRGITATTYRENDKSIDVVLRGAGEERKYLSLMEDLAVPTRAGKSVPLSQIAKISYGFEPGVVWRRNRLPALSVQANLYGKVQAATVTSQILPLLEPIKAKLPAGYRIETGGAVENSEKAGDSVAAGMPLFVLTVLFALMLQLQSLSRTALVVLTAPLGMIGVTLALLISHQPFGFVAMLGTIALSGMIMRNSVILVDQIDHDIAGGKDAWNAIVDATVRRFRPIVLTAAAAILAMIPLARSAFFGPMAVAIMGGLLVATALTLFFLPALYATWFRVREAADAG
ncbi:MAG: efflux RND transporter permease subunit [Proteobacteria bacterium]|nr:efflux RND transporter permease subunit [Pseudomonadota bacterium]HQR03856.1 efflux RND transporter permease subunit [Rhodocyclaceae bacterium]